MAKFLLFTFFAILFLFLQGTFENEIINETKVQNPLPNINITKPKIEEKKQQIQNKTLEKVKAKKEKKGKKQKKLTQEEIIDNKKLELINKIKKII